MARTPASAASVPATASEQTKAVLPAGLMDKIKSDPGGGLSKKAEDNLIPLVYILQGLSPQVQNGNPARIEGAEAGDIWLRNSEKPIIKANEGMVFQPCYFYQDWVEWGPKRGDGYVGRHPWAEGIKVPDNVTKKELQDAIKNGAPLDIELAPHPQDPQRMIIVRKNANVIVHTRYHVGYVYSEDFAPQPFILPLSSTGHTFSKSWMMNMNAQQIDGVAIDKSWVFLWRLRTQLKTNKKGSWYQYTTEKERMIISEDEYNRGQLLCRQFENNELKAEAPMENLARDEAAGSGGGDRDTM